MKKIKDLKEFKLIKENTDGTKQYILIANNNIDLRKKVFEILPKNNINILELKKTETTLEDAFLRLINNKEKEFKEKQEKEKQKENKRKEELSKMTEEERKEAIKKEKLELKKKEKEEFNKQWEENRKKEREEKEKERANKKINKENKQKGGKK